MADKFDPKAFQVFFEKIAETNVKAWEVQTRYLEGLMKRNASLVSELTAAQLARVKDLAETKDVGSLLQSGTDFDQGFSEKLQALYESNNHDWEALQAELNELYTSENEIIKKMQESAQEFVATAKETAKTVVNKAKAATSKKK